ncbi:hypothetical protein HZ994_18035 [Akkermansiaceae bacterium]|nr:hypothetical protein HZ994_18035 [Akkermansiaceae bacterium]
MGMFFVGVAAVGFNETGGEEPIPGWLPFLLLGMLVLGVVLLAVAVIGSRRDADSWMESASRTEASIVVMIVAAPLYFVLRLLFRRQGK